MLPDPRLKLSAVEVTLPTHHPSLRLRHFAGLHLLPKLRHRNGIDRFQGLDGTQDRRVARGDEVTAEARNRYVFQRTEIADGRLLAIQKGYGFAAEDGQIADPCIRNVQPIQRRVAQRREIIHSREGANKLRQGRALQWREVAQLTLIVAGKEL